MSYFVLTPSRLARVSSTSRAIFGHMGSEASPWGPGREGGRRSPRPYLHAKMKFGKLSRLQRPWIRPVVLEGKWWRNEEKRREAYADQFDKDREAEAMAEAEKDGRLAKKEKKPPTLRGRRKAKE